MKLGYYLRVLTGIRLNKLRAEIDAVHEWSGKSKAYIFLDMLFCAAVYGAGYYDYRRFDFVARTHRQRRSFITRRVNRRLNLLANANEYRYIFSNKAEFNRRFTKYLKRNWLCLDEASAEDVQKFIQGKKFIFAKPKEGERGLGIEKIRVSDFDGAEKLHAYLKAKGLDVLEDVIEQHSALARIYPGSVNCLRVVTLLSDDGTPHCIYTLQKFGCDGDVIDRKFGITPDPETGILPEAAYNRADYTRKAYKEHPNTHVAFKDYQLPFIKEAIEMCLEAALVVPQIRYVGWDVALTANGPVLVEGNDWNSHYIIQLPLFTPDGIGMKALFQRLVKAFK